MTGLPERLARLAAEQPGRRALESATECLSYRQLWTEVTALAARLQAQDGQRLGLAGDNSVNWVLADLACRLAGRVCVPIPGFFSSAQRQHLEGSASLDAILQVADTGSGQPLRAGLWLQPVAKTGEPQAMPVGTGKVTFTSGSTGQPKGVCLAHQQLDATVAALARRLEGVALSRHLCVLPLATLLENIAGVYLPLSLGATVVLRPLAELGFHGSSALDTAQLVAALAAERPDSLILVPELAMVIVQAVAEGQLDPECFHFLAVGGGRVAPELIRRARALSVPLYQGYGLSECGSVVALNVPGDDHLERVGRPLDHLSVSIRETGEILVQGQAYLGYLGEPANRCGEVATGDLGALDQDGFLSVSGRQKNLIITSFGRNISPEWLESELLQTLAVRQALVFGDGEPQPSVLLVPRPEQTPEAIREAAQRLNARLPDYARLRCLYLLPWSLTTDQGHVTANGRLVRQRLLADLPTLLAPAARVLLVAPASSFPPDGDPSAGLSILSE
ncbi:AMP-binding protein [Marinobacter sp. CA1]|uniref:AMP-binding protein n=1 Tax=Marinobacter sp. CA1 TaxID=2817656 RepID=UPI001D0604C8|nr:AMP-binding protein [Marinobacter sp. CA1]UDL05293.1 AMP-binding protein [Marinobacter sp. CA1]